MPGLRCPGHLRSRLKPVAILGRGEGSSADDLRPRPGRLCAAATSVGADERATAAASPALQKVGEFDTPTYVTAPPRRHPPPLRHRARRHHQDRARRAELSTPFLDIRSRVSTAGEGGLLSMAFPPDYERSRRFYVYYVDRGGNIRIDEFLRSASDPDAVQGGSRRSVLRQNHHNRNHKGGPAPVRARRAPVRRPGGRGRPGLASQRPIAAHQAGQDPAHRPPPDAHPRVPRPAQQPLPAPPRRAQGDLLVRPAQPLPLLVRPPEGPHAHRRRGPGRARGARLRPHPAGGPGAERRPELRLEHLRGHPPLPPGPGAPAFPPRPPARPLGGRVLDHRRLRDPRPQPGSACTAATSTATSATTTCGSPASAAAVRAATSGWAPPSAHCCPSARTRRDGSTPRRRTARVSRLVLR